ncbi:hypothetical protein FGIG_09887 [Fasciola gigantica]|uniref:Uncharacterized protein n=1 Tax=Fasciola gigantica TaxID=46835 RepID=A0A504YZB0_FASGI|nr:hypothetical protein FGIG_09887 [Fasciola gigantica]
MFVCLLVCLLSPSGTYLVSRAERIRVFPPLVFPGLQISIIFIIIITIHLLNRLHPIGMPGPGQQPITHVDPNHVWINFHRQWTLSHPGYSSKEMRNICNNTN